MRPHRTGGARSSIPALLIAVFLFLTPVEAEAQSNGFGWLRDIERWTHKEDYRTWIAHGVVTTASTLFGHWAFGKAHYGAGAAVMFYAGVEYQELRRDDWVVHNSTDKIMDLTVPITVATVLILILSDDEGSQEPTFLPMIEGEVDSEETGEFSHFRPRLTRVVALDRPIGFRGHPSVFRAGDIRPLLPFLRHVPLTAVVTVAPESPET